MYQPLRFCKVLSPSKFSEVGATGNYCQNDAEKPFIWKCQNICGNRL